MKQVTLTLKVSFPTKHKDTDQIKKNVLRCIPVGLDTSPYYTAIPSAVTQEILGYEEEPIIEGHFLDGRTPYIHVNHPPIGLGDAEGILSAIHDLGYTTGSGTKLTLQELTSRRDFGQGYALFLKDFPYGKIVASKPLYTIHMRRDFVAVSFDQYFNLNCEKV